MNRERSLLLAGAAVPILYFGNLIVSSLFYPGYSHVRQYASELGSSTAAWPGIFNTGIVLTGIAAVLGGLGFFLAVRRLTGRSLLAGLVGLLVVLAGISFVMGGLFPMPDPRHGGFGLGMGIHLAPILLAVALWKRGVPRALSVYLFVTAALMIGFFAVMMGVGSFVTRANVGVFQRLYALCMFPWIGVASSVLRSVPILDRASRSWTPG
jgi:hypothetical membrane protein